jgi:alkanesulfonate monooxygenase SsuD/methylene tetrahydromethanopterin reductase-like flavin-dependent oxidoreductase (luciferase family)
MRFDRYLANQHPLDLCGGALAETIEQVRLARAVGFDMVALGQHFFLPSFKCCSQPLSPPAWRQADASGHHHLSLTTLNPVAVARKRHHWM